MNFNNSNPPAAEPKPRKEKKSNVKLVIGVTLGVIGAVAFIWYSMGVASTINGNVSTSTSTYPLTLTSSEMTQKCNEKLREYGLEVEPSQMVNDMCIRAYNYAANDPNPISANPSVAEITQKCTDITRNILGSEPPKFEVNVCIGTVLAELNK